jgi:nucleoside-diphosphate-sugar epimerase
LIAVGHEVTVFNRGQREIASLPKGVRIMQGDRDDPAALRDAVGAVLPDVLVDFVCFNPVQAGCLAEVALGRVGHLVFVSTVDAFGFPLKTIPVSETAPLNTPVGDYARSKRLCEELLRERLEGHLALTIVRPTLSIGSRFLIGFFDLSAANMIGRLRNDLPIVVPGDGSGLIHPSASADTGAMIARVAGDAAAFGKTYTCGTDAAWRTRDAYVELIASAVGCEPKLLHIPTALIEQTSLAAVQEGLYHNVARFDLAFGFDVFKADFPDFKWECDLITPIRAYVERLDSDGATAYPPRQCIDDWLIAAWDTARRTVPRSERAAIDRR